MAHHIFQFLAQGWPALKEKLEQAGMRIKPDDFIQHTALSAFYLTSGVFIFLFLVLARLKMFKAFLLMVAPFLFLLLFLYFLKLPEVRVTRKERDINREIVFAGRFLIIELESGVPLYNALVNLAKNYQIIGKYIKEIIDKVELGTALEDAIAESSEINPSNDLRRILWQIINSLRTGSNVAESITTVVEQISREQAIEMSRYGRKLNPLAMFYMMVAVIFPSLGVTMLIILASFIQFQLTLELLLFFAVLIGFIQFMFIAVVKFSRPPADF